MPQKSLQEPCAGLKDHLTKKQQFSSIPDELEEVDSSEETSSGLEVFVGGLPTEATEETLILYFSQFGGVELPKRQGERPSGKKQKFKGFAIIECLNQQTYDAIISFPNHIFQDRMIECKPKL